MAEKHVGARSLNVPQYFFHLHNDIDVPDDEGEMLADLEAAKTYATRQIRALIGEGAKTNGRIVLHHRIDIEDADHKVIASVRYSDVLRIED